MKRAVHVDLTHSSDEEKPQKRSRQQYSSWMPFYLLKLRCLEGVHADNCISLHDLITDGVRCVLFLNYKVDVEWIISECPYLKVQTTANICNC